MGKEAKKDSSNPHKKPKTFESAFNIYEDLGQIGTGGSGTVIRVSDGVNRNLALKHLNPNNVSAAKSKRFQNELSFCERNQYKNIIKVIDHGYITLKNNKCPFYVMPYYPGTLRDLIKNGINPAKILPLFSQMLDGIEAAHLQKVWHRDLKPENMLYDPQSDSLIIADFGIAHFEEDQLHTTVNTTVHDRLANFQYAAPEQRIFGTLVDYKADIYALGMILNEMFTRTLPLGTNYKRINDVSPDHRYLDSLVELMLSNSPEQRPNSIDAIKKDLIARGNQFIIEQKVSELKNAVVPESEIDDPLIIAPPQLKTFDYNNGVLLLTLDKNVNAEWIEKFQYPRTSYEHPWGLGPTNFAFNKNNVASVRVESDNAQKAIDQFKQYSSWANQSYKVQIQRNMEAEERERREQLKLRLRNEEERQKVLKNLKI